MPRRTKCVSFFLFSPDQEQKLLYRVPRLLSFFPPFSFLFAGRKFFYGFFPAGDRASRSLFSLSLCSPHEKHSEQSSLPRSGKSDGPRALFPPLFFLSGGVFVGQPGFFFPSPLFFALSKKKTTTPLSTRGHDYFFLSQAFFFLFGSLRLIFPSTSTISYKAYVFFFPFPKVPFPSLIVCVV